MEGLTCSPEMPAILEIRVRSKEGDGRWKEQVHRRADHRDLEGAPGGAIGAEVCRKHGVSDATFYKWRCRYGGMEVSDARRLKALEDENRKLKKLLAESMIDEATLKEMLTKNF